MAKNVNNTQQDALILVHLRNQFYKKKFHFALAIYVLSLIVVFVLLSILIYIIKNPVHPLYFVTDSVGRLIQDVPLDKPNVSTQEAAQYAKEAVEGAYSYDFINYRGQLQGMQKYFSEYGWRNYMQGLTDSNNLLALTQRKLIMIGRVIGQPKLVAEAVLNGIYSWRFEMELLVTYLTPPYDEKSKFSNPLTMRVVLQRQSILTSYRGLGVVQMIGSLVLTTPSQNLSTPTGL